jgi:outer membrane autotransporter protein
MNSFLGLMVDQSLDAGNGNGAPAMPIKAPPARSSQPWSAWGSAYGGTNHANGDATVVGSHDVRTNTWGIAAGLDYRLSPDTKIGFALGGAGTNWGLSDGLGGGKSDAFQAGIYGLTRSGPAYLSAALAFSSYWVSTDRVAFASDQLTANFNAYGVGGRLEGGYRFATPVVGFTPYAALQAQSFHIPGYSETDVTGGGFGLAFNEHTASDTRSELGARLDKQIALDNGAVLALRGRAAWAHDWVTDPSLTAAFLALPGGGAFIVNGATPAHDSALVTAGAEIKLRSGWSVMAKFDGEFASGSQTYIGTGKLRYSW